MTIYHWLVILLVLLALLLRGGRKGSAVFIFLAFALMFCIQGLRDNRTIGNDSRTSYRAEFNMMGDKEWEDLGGIRDWIQLEQKDKEYSSQDRNFAIRWLMKFVYDYTDGDYQWFIAIVALIVLSTEAIVIYKYSTSPIQSILYYLGLLFFSFQMSATKQSLAMSLILLSLTGIIDRKPFRFFILVIVASFFHFPAIIFLPAYWVANMKIENSYLFFLAGLFVLTYIFRDRLVILMNDAYYSSEIETASSLRFLANKVIVMLVIIAVALLVRPPHHEDRIYCALLQLMGIAAAIQTFAGYNNIFERLADYYFQFAVIFIPMVFEGVKTNKRYLQENTVQLICDVGPYVFGSFAIWRFLDNIINDVHFTPFRFFFE